MSLSTTVAASARPRKDSRSAQSPKVRAQSSQRQASGSEEELAMRQHRRNATKTPCCVICCLTTVTLTAALVLNVCFDSLLSRHWT